ncbi:8798_t:CDS:2 [Funneliformis mosseae]|uniref:8798_t:CDS:1 n=1 Tax=Funneliformis mosseae TaxID=27381 RepID=A0A9N9N965_FUNMO|nr:8798_t:CDS:2 [Funneliformis mosseae]
MATTHNASRGLSLAMNVKSSFRVVSKEKECTSSITSFGSLDICNITINFSGNLISIPCDPIKIPLSISVLVPSKDVKWYL